jgi:adenylate kinase family enzyme
MAGMERVLVLGPAGAGKTTFAAALARDLGFTHIELDSIYHQPGWTALSDGEFRERVDLLTTESGWVVDGNYSSTLQDVLWSRADTIVWLDLPRTVATRRVLFRTLKRLTTRRELWNGNRERWRDQLSLDPTRSLIVWAWTRHGKYARRYETDLQDPRWGHAHFLRLKTPAEVKSFLRRLPG